MNRALIYADRLAAIASEVCGQPYPARMRRGLRCQATAKKDRLRSAVRRYARERELLLNEQHAVTCPEADACHLGAGPCPAEGG